MSTQKTLFIVGAQHMTFEQCKKFADYSAAEEEAIFVSTCAPGFQIEVCVAEKDAKGPVVAACQFGQLLHVVQTKLFAVEGKAEVAFRKHVGKQWWLLIANYTAKIEKFRSRWPVHAITEEEMREYEALENVTTSLIEHLQTQMPEHAFQSAKWKYVDCAKFKNRTPEKPESIRDFEDCTLRKFNAQAYEITGHVALTSRWILHESAMGNIEQFIRSITPKSKPETMEKPRPKRKPKLQVIPAEQLRLFA